MTPFAEYSDAEFLLYLAQNDYSIDGKLLEAGLRLTIMSARLTKKEKEVTCPTCCGHGTIGQKVNETKE